MELRKKPQQEPDAEVNKAVETILLEDGRAGQRAMAANALKVCGTRANLPALRKALNDHDRTVRNCAKLAIAAVESRTDN